MSRILRFEVPVDDQWHTITGCTMPMYVGCRTPGIVEFWAWERPTSRPRRYRVIGTGHPIDDDDDVWYCGTAIAPGGQLVWHLVEHSID